MDVLTFLNQNWFPLSALLAGLAWLIRLEGKVKAHSEKHVEVTKTTDKMWNKFEGMEASLSTIMQSVAKIQGILEERNAK